MKAGQQKISALYIIGLVFGILFLFLLGIRLDFFQLTKSPEKGRAISISNQESWMSVFRHDQKIGYSHRLLEEVSEGYRIYDRSHLRLNVMGMIQDMKIKTEGTLKDDFSLSAFSFELSSGLFDFSASGHVKGDMLYIQMDDQHLEFPLSEPIYMIGGILDAAGVHGLKPGETRAYYVFDPASFGRKPVEVTLVGYETISIMEQPVKTLKYSLDFMGLRQTAWMTEDGDVVKEEGLMGIRMVKADKKSALADMGSTGLPDLTESISVAANINIKDQNSLPMLKMNLSGATDKFFLDGGRQTYEGGTLTIEKEKLTPAPMESRDAENISFLKPSAVIQSNHPKIKQQVSEILSMDDSAFTKTSKIMAWITQNIAKRPVLSIPNALETLENRMGDCNEHAVLFAAMARAAGIPTQIEAGLVHMEGRFYYHAWNAVFLGRWITVDALMGQLPADVTHIRLIRGNTMDQLDLVHAIDNLTINISETVNDRTL